MVSEGWQPCCRLTLEKLFTPVCLLSPRSLKAHLGFMTNITGRLTAFLVRGSTLTFVLRSVQLYSVQHTSSTSACRFQTSLVGHSSVLLNAVTCWFLAPELSSADGVFQLLHRPSGTLFRHICTRH